MDICPQCGAELGGPDELCPVCLLAGGFSLSEAAETKLTVASERLSKTAPHAALDSDAFGPYQIVRVLGEGGMGTVYLAEQTYPLQRRVALKVIKPGLGTSEILSRFAYERQALALMDHPNIARVYDAGATGNGRPFFVMEYIDGVPVTQYCNERRLNTRERLELFIPVCQALQHAHSKGVIHRDIKPSNVMVVEQDGLPVPKVIDFGIAKAIDQRAVENAAFTKLGQFIGTPEYMSPEQADLISNDIDTSSDVYSLGVLLYELLVGAVPFDSVTLRKAGLAELLRIIREDEAPALHAKLTGLGQTATRVAAQRRTDPGSLKRQLAGDLNWIVMKALEKERQRRYLSVADLAADVHRHLKDQPVLASPPGAVYHAGKFVRRHKVSVAAALVVAGALVAGVIGVGWEAHIAELRRQEAEVQRALADQHRLVAEREQRRAESQRQLAIREKVRADEQRRLALRAEHHAEQQRQEAENQRDRNRRLLYAAEMNLALQRWESNNPVGIEEFLRSYIPKHGEEDPRGLEWYYLWRNAHRERASLRMRGGATGVAFSPDGRLLAVGQPGKVLLLDLVSAREFATLPCTGGSVGHLIFTADGKLLAGTAEKNGRLWDMKSLREVASWAARTPGLGVGSPVGPGSASFARDGGKLLIIDEKHAARVLDTGDGHELFASKPDGASVAALSPDGKRIAIHYLKGQAATIIELASGRELVTLKENTQGINDLQFSPDGRLLASACTDNTARLWDATTGDELRTFRGHSQPVRHIAFSPDGRLLATASEDWTTKIWRISSGEELNTLRSRLGAYDLAFSPDGRLLAVTGQGVVNVWDVAPETGILSRDIAGTGLAFSPDGKVLFLTNQSATRVWDLPAGTERPVLPGSAGRVALAGNGKRLATSYGNMITLWDPAIQSMQFTLNWPKPIRSTFTTSIAISPDGRTLLTGQDDGILRVWDTVAGRQVSEIRVVPDVRPPTYLNGTLGINCLAFAPDGKTFVTASGDKNAVIWDVTTLQPVLTLQHPHVVQRAEFERTGRFLVTSDNYINRIWDVRTGREQFSLGGGPGSVGEVAFSSDGSRIVTGGRDTTLRIWPVIAGGREMMMLRGHSGVIKSIAVSPRGDAFASTSNDGVLRLWRVATPETVEVQLKDAGLEAGLRSIRAGMLAAGH